MSDVNRTRGRTYGNNMLRYLANDLENLFAGRLHFYRLDGIRFIASVDPSCTQNHSSLIDELRSVIEAGYRFLGITVHFPCAFALINYNAHEYISSAEFLEHLVALIKMARHEPNQKYISDSHSNRQKIDHLSDISVALNQDVLHDMRNFRIVIQPIVSAESKEIVGGEALLRWRFEGEDVSPSIFVPCMEKEGMIAAAGRWVFEQSVRTCIRLIPMVPEFSLSINISPFQLHDAGFIEYMQKILEKYRLDGRHLTVELSESCMDDDPERLFQFVHTCTSLKIKVALDDFGRGSSSLRVLLQYPSDIIKLDRSLLQEITASTDKMNFISSLVFACHRFGKQVCMEGVENDIQDIMVKKCDCDMIQGFHYYKPLEKEDIYRLFSSGSPV